MRAAIVESTRQESIRESHDAMESAKTTPAQPELSDEAFEILRAALNLVRNYQIKRLTTLRKRLVEMFPGKDAQINEAINT